MPQSDLSTPNRDRAIAGTAAINAKNATPSQLSNGVFVRMRTTSDIMDLIRLPYSRKFYRIGRAVLHSIFATKAFHRFARRRTARHGRLPKAIRRAAEPGYRQRGALLRKAARRCSLVMCTDNFR